MEAQYHHGDGMYHIVRVSQKVQPVQGPRYSLKAEMFLMAFEQLPPLKTQNLVSKSTFKISNDIIYSS